LHYPDPKVLLDFCIKNEIKSIDSTDLLHHINYMLSPDFFNKHLPDFYIESANQLNNFKIISSFLQFIDEINIQGHESLLKFYTKQDLLSESYELIGIKT